MILDGMQVALTYDDVLLVPQYSEVASRKDCDTSIKIKSLYLEVPILASNMSSVVSKEMIVALSKAGGMVVVDQLRTVEDEANLIKWAKKEGQKVAGACGVRGDYQERALNIVSAGADMLVFDTPHGDSLNCVEAVRWARGKFPNILIAAGNIATGEAVKRLVSAGVDILKVGVGPGAACMTRVNTGVGYPQWSAVANVAKVAKKLGGFVIADGGVSTAGNFAKAIGAGADLVMCGSIFAGCDEAPGEVIEEDGKKFKTYWGSASVVGKQERTKRDDAYRGIETEFVEGEAGKVSYRGKVGDLVAGYKMGLVSAMSYSNAKTIGEFHKNAEFVQITAAGIKENGAHGLV